MTTERISQMMDLIIKVRSGVTTATAAAQALGISRRTYYKWEARALRGMQNGLTQRDGGRPAAVTDPEKEKLRKELEDLRTERVIWDQIQRVREELGLLPGDTAKKKGSSGGVAGRDRPGARDQGMLIPGGQPDIGGGAGERQAVARPAAERRRVEEVAGAEKDAAVGHGGSKGGGEGVGPGAAANSGNDQSVSALSAGTVAPGTDAIGPGGKA